MRPLTGVKMKALMVAAMLAAPIAAQAQQPGSEPTFVQDTRMAPAVSDGSCSGPECPFNNIPKAVDQAAAIVSGAPEIDANDKAIGKHIVDGMFTANRYQDGGTRDKHDPNVSLYYSYNFKHDFADLWKDEYEDGYADPKYWDHVGFMTWKIKPGVSAAAAIKSWLKGRTIAECMTTVRALQTDALRAAVGDAAFDRAFGSTDGSTPTKGYLTITPIGSSIDSFLRTTDPFGIRDPGSVGHRDAQPGEHYYFQNHPKYLLKHPAGAWQGENALYAGVAGKDVPVRDPDKDNDDDGLKKGEQVWTGFGADLMTEPALYKEMVSAYNQPRDADDLKWLSSHFGADPAGWPKEYQENSGSFPDSITVKDVLNAEPYTVRGRERTGGFLPTSGKVLDVGKVKDIRGHQQTVPLPQPAG